MNRSAVFFPCLALLLTVVGLGLMPLNAPAAQPIFSENFDGLALGPNTDEALAEPQAWTKTPPAGWSIDDSGVPGAGTPNDGVTEWAGWSFAKKDWWAATAGDQRRTEFVNGSGNVAVADPDEWDDQAHPGGPPEGPWYNTYLSTPVISLANMKAGTATLGFDSSWRDEYDDNYHQTANITVSYDGGASVEVLRWDSDSASPNFHDDAPNEQVIVILNNPEGASGMVLKFGLFEAGNDWWWAVDNVSVSAEAVPEPSSIGLALGALLGLTGLCRRRK